MAAKIILLAVNEVPWRIIDEFVRSRPISPRLAWTPAPAASHSALSSCRRDPVIEAGSDRPEVSTLDIAPAILANYGVARPGHMRTATSFSDS